MIIYHCKISFQIKTNQKMKDTNLIIVGDSIVRPYRTRPFVICGTGRSFNIDHLFEEVLLDPLNRFFLSKNNNYFLRPLSNWMLPIFNEKFH